MAGAAVGIIGTGGVGVATASALIMRGIAGRVTIYGRNGGAAHGLALDFCSPASRSAAEASTTSTARTSW
jgi:malate/lactate dehydrogenase